jgi:hypothetical protein
VNAITISDESKKEAKLEREILRLMTEDPLSADGQSQDEEVFIAQLHRRARLLNDGFQRRVFGVVESHASKTVPADQRGTEPIYFSSSVVESQSLSDVGSQSLFPVPSQQPASAQLLVLDLQDSKSVFVHSKQSDINAAAGHCNLMITPDGNRNSFQALPVRRPSWETSSSWRGSARQSLEGRLAHAKLTSPSSVHAELCRAPARTMSSFNNPMQARTSSSTTFSESVTDSIVAGSSEMITCEFKEGEAVVEVCCMHSILCLI